MNFPYVAYSKAGFRANLVFNSTAATKLRYELPENSLNREKKSALRTFDIEIHGLSVYSRTSNQCTGPIHPSRKAMNLT